MTNKHCHFILNKINIFIKVPQCLNLSNKRISELAIFIILKHERFFMELKCEIRYYIENKQSFYFQRILRLMKSLWIQHQSRSNHRLLISIQCISIEFITKKILLNSLIIHLLRCVN